MDLVGGGQALRAADLVQQLPAVVPARVPVEGVDPVGAVVPVPGGDGAGPQAVLVVRRLGADPGAGEAAVEARVHGDAVGPAEIGEAGHVDVVVGARAAGGNDEVHQALLQPGGQVVADLLAHVQVGGHAHGDEERTAALAADFVSAAARGPLQVGEDVAQAEGVVVGQVEGVPLPVQLDAVPVVALADLADVVEAVAADLGDRHVPGEGEPLGGAVAQEPLGVAAPQLGQLRVVQGGQVGDLGAVEVVVVHAHRGVDLQPQAVAALDERRLRVLAALQHEADVLGVRQRPGPFVAPAVDVAELLQDVGGPARGVLADAPEQGAHLGLFQGRVHALQEGLHRLGDLVVPVRGPVPVVDDAVGWWCGSHEAA